MTANARNVADRTPFAPENEIKICHDFLPSCRREQHMKSYLERTICLTMYSASCLSTASPRLHLDIVLLSLRHYCDGSAGRRRHIGFPLLAVAAQEVPTLESGYLAIVH